MLRKICFTLLLLSTATFAHDLKMDIINYTGQVTATVQEWKGGQWVEIGKDISTYDSFGNLTELLHQDLEGSAYVNSGRETWEYDPSGKHLKQLTMYEWRNNSWVPFMQNVNTIENNKKTTSLSKVWDGTGWMDLSLSEYSYNQAGQLVEEVDKTNMFINWTITGKTTYSYDANGNCVQESSTSTNMMTGVEENSSRNIHKYDSNNRIIETTGQGWNESAWENITKLMFNYDASGNQATLELQTWENNAWVNWMFTKATYVNGRLIESLMQLWNGSAWENDMRYLYEYGTSTAVDNSKTGMVPENFSLLNYPNPFNPTTTIQFELPASSFISLRIFDVNGRLIQDLVNNENYQAGTYSILWNGKNYNNQPVPSGVYFYQIQADRFSQTKRCTLVK